MIPSKKEVEEALKAADCACCEFDFTTHCDDARVLAAAVRSRDEEIARLKSDRDNLIEEQSEHAEEMAGLKEENAQLLGWDNWKQMEQALRDIKDAEKARKL